MQFPRGGGAKRLHPPPPPPPPHTHTHTNETLRAVDMTDAIVNSLEGMGPSLNLTARPRV